ncbi:hypothetical protein HA402_004475 [Bradysia odoriphaga]|nr:hypothetical protein HA402_004475 [Bradysia odoriphaga]
MWMYESTYVSIHDSTRVHKDPYTAGNSFTKKPSTGGKRKGRESSSSSSTSKRRYVSSPTTKTFKNFHALFLQFMKIAVKLKSMIQLSAGPDLGDKVRELTGLRLFIGYWLRDLNLITKIIDLPVPAEMIKII